MLVCLQVSPGGVNYGGARIAKFYASHTWRTENENMCTRENEP